MLVVQGSNGKDKPVQGLIPQGAHEAKLVGLRNARGRPGECVKRFVFRISRGECKNAPYSYFVALNGRDNNLALKLVLYFLGYNFRSVETVNFDDVVERRCKIKIRHKKRNGRVFPEIYGFDFSSDYS